MRTKFGPIIGIALAALAFGIPVAAASANWTQTGSPLTGEQEVELAGDAGFFLVGSETGVHATLKIKAMLLTGTSGLVVDFKDTDCTGTGVIAPLRCTGTPVDIENWRLHKVGHQIRIAGFRLVTHFYHPLDTGHTTPLSTILMSITALATPDDPKAIESVQLEGEEVFLDETVAVGFGGTLVASPAGEYGTT